MNRNYGIFWIICLSSNFSGKLYKNITENDQRKQETVSKYPPSASIHVSKSLGENKPKKRELKEYSIISTHPVKPLKLIKTPYPNTWGSEFPRSHWFRLIVSSQSSFLALRLLCAKISRYAWKIHRTNRTLFFAQKKSKLQEKLEHMSSSMNENGKCQLIKWEPNREEMKVDGGIKDGRGLPYLDVYCRGKSLLTYGLNKEKNLWRIPRSRVNPSICCLCWSLKNDCKSIQIYKFQA